MPSIVKIRVVEARHLPVMDRATGSTDGFVVVKFAGREEQTSVKRKTMQPKWDEDFRFDIQDDAALQNEPLVLRVMDSDNFGASNPIGTCHVSLTPLLTKDLVSSKSFSNQTSTSGLAGWFPIFDTLEGIRGELFLAVKVQNVADENPFSDSSSLVEIFSSSWLDPETIAVERVLGFVEELVVDEDPEYSWSNNFYSARLTNDARLQLMYKLSMAVRRLVGKKALELGGNAVIGYQQHFDIEGNSGMVCRGYGTACIISKARMRKSRRRKADDMKTQAYITVMGSRTLPVFSDGTATSSIYKADETVYGVVPHPFLLDLRKDSPNQQYLNSTLPSDEATILTMHSFPVNLRLQLGGVVAARSVKYLGRLNVFKADRETRDQWWAELRAEVKSHAAALHCNYVVGYSETCVIYDDVCVLCATGTAAVLKESKPVWKVEREDEEDDPEAEHERGSSQKGLAKVDEANAGEDSKAQRAEEETKVGQEGADSSKPEVADEEQANGAKQSLDREPSDQTVGLPDNGSGTPEASQLKPASAQSSRDKSPRLSVVLLDDEDATMLAARTWSRKKKRREIHRQRRRVLRAVLPCYSMHVPFKQNAAPFANMRLVPCGICKNKWVPEIMLSTTEPPPMLPITGGGTLVEARVCKSRGKADTRENDAGTLGEQLVFLEIELHRQLMLKLKVMGMNAAFSLRSQVNFAADILVGVISATAVHTSVLPPPAVLRIKRNIAVVDTEDRMLMDLQNRIEALADENRERLLKIAVAEAEAVREALRVARAKRNQALETEAAELKWRKIGEMVAKDAAFVAKDRLQVVEQVHRAATTPDAEKSFAASSHGAAGSTSIQNKTSGWFARRRRNQDHAELNIESTRWQGRLRANLGLGTVRSEKAPPTANLPNHTTAPGGGTTGGGGKSPSLTSYPAPQHGEGVVTPMSVEPTQPREFPSPEHPEPLAPSSRHMEDKPHNSGLGSHSLKHHHSNEAAGAEKKTRDSRLVNAALVRANSTLSNSSSSSSSSSSTSSSDSSSSDNESDSSSEENLDEEDAEALLQELRGDKNCFVVEIDDERDEDVMAVLFDRQTPPDVALCTSNTLPQFFRRHQIADSGTFVSAVRSAALDRGRSTRLNSQVASLFHQTYALLALKVSRYSPCVVGGLRVQLSVPTDDTLVLTLTATISRLKARSSPQGDALVPADLKDIPLGLPALMTSVFSGQRETSPGLNPAVDTSPTLGLPSRSPTGAGPLLALKKHIWGISSVFGKSMHLLRSVSRSTTGDSVGSHHLPPGMSSAEYSTHGSSFREGGAAAPATIAGILGISTQSADPSLPGDPRRGSLTNMMGSSSVLSGASSEDEISTWREGIPRPYAEAPLPSLSVEIFRPNVVLTALEYVPGARVSRYLGRINIHLIKESAVVRESGGLSSFYYPFMLQAQAIARAHVEALGGNALLSFRMVRRESGGQKNQTYNLISLSGDAVLVTFAGVPPQGLFGLQQ